MLFQPDLELLTAGGDAPLTLELDALDLAVGPGVDALDVFLGELAKIFGLEGLARPDRVDVGLASLLGSLGITSLLSRRRRLHRLGEVGQKVGAIVGLLGRIVVEPVVGAGRQAAVGAVRCLTCVLARGARGADL